MQDTATDEAFDVVQLMVGAAPVVTEVGLIAITPEAVAAPVPDRLRVPVPFVPLVVTLTVPVRAPDVDGVNDTLTVQVPLTARAAAQLLDEPKSLEPEDTETPVTVKLAVPLLVMVTDWVALVVPTVWLPNDSDVVEYEALPCRPTPVEVDVSVPALVGTDSV